MVHKLLGLLFILAILAGGCAEPEKSQADLDALAESLSTRKVMLPNGWAVSPAGKNVAVGDLPMNLIYSKTQKLFAITNNGQSDQSIMLANQEGFVLDTFEMDRSWYGLAFHPEKPVLFASGGNNNTIFQFDVTGGKLVLVDSVVLGKPWPDERISPTGITLDSERNILYITTKEDSSLYIADLNQKKNQRIKLGHEAYSSVLSPDRKVLYISLWGGSKVVVFNTTSNTISAEIPLSANPNELLLTRNGKYLFAAQANDNGVSVIDTETRKVKELLTTALFPDAPTGSTPNGLALAEDEMTLYIANADNNSLAVFDVSTPGESKSIGFIPVGWYPTSVKVVNKKIYVTNGKGGQSFANPQGPSPYERRNKETQYIGGLFKGTLSVLDEPTPGELKVYTKAVYQNSPYSKEIEKLAEGEEGNPIPRTPGDSTPIKYVFYIIKENRTYDQVFGDITKGNGDTSLCLFPAVVTPNQHKLANEFVLLDNFYVNAEVSADGHNWSTAAYANDYVEKTWPTNYSGRGGNYDYEGSRGIAFPKGGFIWEYCQRAGVSYRSYGEFVYSGRTGIKALEGHFDRDFPSYDLNIPDQVRFEKWRQDFDSLLAIDAVASFNTIRLPNDHTAGARVGMPTPKAMVAENDLALGQMIAHLSKSKIWSQSVIFVLEDDAQNGPDHVDAHRSIALVVGPYVKRNAVISRMYSTASMLRTMELILGLPPMSQYDAGATPMWECFTPVANLSPFSWNAATYNIKEMNVERNSISKASETFNLKVMDAVPDLAFSEVIWKSVKGLDSKVPAPVRGAFIHQLTENEEESEDE